MSTPIPTFSGEVQFRRYSDTSTQGASIVLGLADRDELSAFVGKEGRRFMAVLVEVGDDEQPASAPAKLGPLAYWLVRRCNEPEFLGWINAETDVGSVAPVVGPNDAKHAVCEILGIDSRKDIDGDAVATNLFHERIRGPYSKWLLRRGVVT